MILLSNTSDIGIQNIANYLESRFSTTLSLNYKDALGVAFEMLARMPDVGVVYKGY
jgi:hypothetical protein